MLTFWMNTNFLNISFLIINLLVLIPKSFSTINIFNFTNNDTLLFELANKNYPSKNNFIQKPTLFKSYGPLFIDMNNIKYNNGLFFIPTINDQSKPLFLAVYCTDSLINVKGSDGWKGWRESFYSFENNLVNKLCDSIDKY